MTVKYSQSFNDIINFSDSTASLTLTANNILTYTVPGLATTTYQLEFGASSTANIFVGYNTTPAIPASNTISVSGASTWQEFLPRKPRQVKGGDVLKFISPDTTAYMGLSLRVLTSS